MRPLPSEEATPPVTKMCFVCSTTGFNSTSCPAVRTPGARPAPSTAAAYQASHSPAASAPSGSAAAARAAAARPAVACRSGSSSTASTRSRQAGGVADRHQQADALDQVAQPAGVAGHHRHAGRHRLLHDQRPGLPGAGQDEDVRGAQQVGRVGRAPTSSTGAPVRRTRSSSPRLRSGSPSPTTTQRHGARSAAAASTSVPRSFWGAIREIVSTRGRPAPAGPSRRSRSRSRPAPSSTWRPAARAPWARARGASRASAAPSALPARPGRVLAPVTQVGPPGDPPLDRGLHPAQPASPGGRCCAG